MKPDFVKIIFIGIPLTFSFWVFTLFAQMFFLPDSFNYSYPRFSLYLTILFVPVYFALSVKYTKKINPDDDGGNIRPDGKSNITKVVPQSIGIWLLVMIVLLVSTMVVSEVFYGIESGRVFQLAIVPLSIVSTLIERRFRKRA
jgi:Ca2+/Na+ antiporter